MIVEFVQFKQPAGWTREQVLADARDTVAKWRANDELVRKHYLRGDDMLGAFYIWPSREAAERGHDAEWRAGVERRTGSKPVIQYFDLLMVLDNEAGSVREFPPDAP